MSKKQSNKGFCRYISVESNGRFLYSVSYLACPADADPFVMYLGAYSGYAGGGVYEAGFFSICGSHFQVLDFDQVEQGPNSVVFNHLLEDCGRMYVEQDSEFKPSNLALSMLIKGFKNNDCIVYCDECFDFYLLAEVSHNWLISLRFDT